MMNRPLTHRFLVIAGLLSVTCVIGAIAAALMRPPRFTTRVQAIGFVLAQRDIAYENIYINRNWPDSVNTISYTARLLIVERYGAEVPGIISCRDQEHDCYISIDRFGIDRVPIPNLSPPVDNPTLEWIESRYADLRMGRVQWP